VLAPSDRAFEAVDDIERLLEPSARDELRALLQVHILAGRWELRDLAAAERVRTMQGTELTVTADGPALLIGGARMQVGDHKADNGVLHVIDQVLTVAETPTIAELVVGTPRDELTTLRRLLQQTGLAETLAGSGPFTLLAPTNAAFEADDLPDLPAADAPDAPDEATLAAWRDYLLGHLLEGEFVVAERIAAASGSITAFQTGTVARSMTESSWPVQATPDVTRVGGAIVVGRDIPCSNGRVQIIDRVLLPDGAREQRVSVLDLLDRGGSFVQFRNWLTVAGERGTLDEGGPSTVFAPVDEAFRKVAASREGELFDNPERLREIVGRHIVPMRIGPNDPGGVRWLPTRGDQGLTLMRLGGEWILRGGQALEPPIEGDNGVLVRTNIVLDSARRATPYPTISRSLSDARAYSRVLEAWQAATSGPVPSWWPTKPDGSRIPVTLLAATDEALQSLEAAGGSWSLPDLLIAGEVTSAMIGAAAEVFANDGGATAIPTLGGTRLRARAEPSTSGGEPTVWLIAPDGTEVGFQQTNQPCADGMLHILRTALNTGGEGEALDEASDSGDE